MLFYLFIDKNCFQEMASTWLKTYLNQFWPGFAPYRTGRAYRPTVDGKRARCQFPRTLNPTSALQASLSTPETPPKINTSYGLVASMLTKWYL